jgi:hypothetical protein
MRPGMRALTRCLERERIEYAIIGGMALAQHGLVRMTQDVYVLMTQESPAWYAAILYRR